MHEEIKRLKLGVPLERVLSHFNQTIQHNRKCQCPWHDGDNTPSLHVYSDRVFCFACGKSADIFDIIAKYTGLTSLQEQKGYLMRTFMNGSSQNQEYDSPYREKVGDSCKSDRKNIEVPSYRTAIKIVEGELRKYTQAYLSACNDIPDPYKRFFKRKCFDVPHLISPDFFKNNILFLHSREHLINVLKKRLQDFGYNWKECGLFKENGNLCVLFEWSFCLLVPVYTIQSNGEFIVTTIIVRNIDLSSKFKDFYFITGDKAKLIEHEGFAGLKRAFDQYPENVKNFCDGLTVALVEGTTDFISAHLLSQQFNIFGGSNEKIIILTAGGVYNTIKESNLQLIKNCTRLIIAFDRDDAGETGFERVKSKATRIGFKHVERFQFVHDFKGKDLNDLLIAHTNRRSI